jgi:hypothetical protein
MTPEQLMVSLVTSLVEMNNALAAAGFKPVHALGLPKNALDFLNGSEVFPAQMQLEPHILGARLLAE